MDELQRIEQWLGPLLQQLQPAQQRTLARQLAQRVRKANQKTMAAQQAPDGTAWQPRKNRNRATRIARVHHEGLRDQVAPGGAQYDYPERPLIGIPDALADELVDMILQRITDGK